MLFTDVLLAACLAGAATPPFSMTPCDCGLGSFAAPAGMGVGLAAADVDDDGAVDLFVPTEYGAPDRVYRNLGDGTFEEVASKWGLDQLEQTRLALWVDYDGDGDLDLLRAGDRAEAPTTYRLYRHDQSKGGPLFVDVTETAGLFQPLPEPVEPVGRHRGGLCAGDLSGDGRLDIVSAIWNGYPQIFRNQGGVRFDDVTKATGITTIAPFSHQVVLLDANRDGRQDLYIAVDYLFNALYINGGDGTFLDIAPQAHANNAWNDMGVAIGDYDRDGDDDLFVTNITDFGVHNILLRRDGSPSEPDYTEVAAELGISAGGWGWGVTFLDADNDGWLDIAATNGWTGPNWENDVSRFWWSRGAAAGEPVVFEDAADAVGFNDTEWGSSLIAFDVDRDGDLDLVQSCMEGIVRVWRNDLDSPASSITIRPRMPKTANRHAIGAELQLRTGAIVQRRLISAGTSYLGQEPAEAHFGLGSAAGVDRLEIRWPDGRRTAHFVAPGVQLLDVTPDDGTPLDCPADLDEDDTVGTADLMVLLGNWGACGSACAGDLVMTGTVDFADLLQLLAHWGPCSEG